MHSQEEGRDETRFILRSSRDKVPFQEAENPKEVFTEGLGRERPGGQHGDRGSCPRSFLPKASADSVG